jgi:hypothetical protein
MICRICGDDKDEEEFPTVRTKYRAISGEIRIHESHGKICGKCKYQRYRHNKKLRMITEVFNSNKRIE